MVQLRGGGDFKVPYNVAYALAILGEYINNELEEQSKLEGEPQANSVNARLASSALTWLKDDIARIAADRAKREEAERARAELQAELRGIDDKWKLSEDLQRSFRAAVANRELQHEFRVIDDKWKSVIELQQELRSIGGKHELRKELRAVDEKYKTGEACRAAVANFELGQELRTIDNQYKTRAELQAELRAIDGKHELRKELRAIDATHGLTGHPKPYYANYKAEKARNAQIASWQLKQELRTIDNQYKTRAELQAELRAIDGKYELRKELRAIDYKYEPRIYLQRAKNAAAAADGSRCELVAELGADHAAVKTVSACCNLAWALVDVCGAVHALTTLRQPELVVEDNAHATGLADQALSHVLEALFHLTDYQERWVEDYSANVSGVFAAMTGVVMGDPSTFMTGVLTTPAQQAQGATR